jgi:hypothetical protein
VLLTGIVLVDLVVDVIHDVMIGQWVAKIPEYLMPLAGLGILTVLTWRAAHRPE